uniref:Ig-like domain-containing protein n=1 Tax=Esox lucius TaxID=8010 RepID=A0A3P8Y227_ESOLU
MKVINKPSFVKTLGSVSVAVGNPLHLECQLDEDIGVSITWLKDGKKLHQTVDCKQSFEDKMVSLDILSITARLQCTVKGSPELHVTWFLNDKELSAGNKYKITFKDGIATLEISDIALIDSGNYTCEVLNEAGCESCSTMLTIKEPPLFIKKIENTTAVLGDTVKLQGTIKGSAPINVKWMKDSQMLWHDEPNVIMAFQNNIAILTIANVDICHGGTYTCLAENEAGQQKCEASLAVQVLGLFCSSCSFPI